MRQGDALRVLFVLPEYGVSVRGGIARFYEHVIAGLRSVGHEIEVCIASCDALEVAAENVPVWGLERKQVMAADSRLSHLAIAEEPALSEWLLIVSSGAQRSKETSNARRHDQETRSRQGIRVHQG